jgi:hypothetical protein
MSIKKIINIKYIFNEDKHIFKSNMQTMLDNRESEELLFVHTTSISDVCRHGVHVILLYLTHSLAFKVVIIYL